MPVLSNLSVYCGVKQGIYCLNLFKGFKPWPLLHITAALRTYTHYTPTIWTLAMKMYGDKNLVGLTIHKSVQTWVQSMDGWDASFIFACKTAYRKACYRMVITSNNKKSQPIDILQSPENFHMHRKSCSICLHFLSHYPFHLWNVDASSCIMHWTIIIDTQHIRLQLCFNFQEVLF